MTRTGVASWIRKSGDEFIREFGLREPLLRMLGLDSHFPFNRNGGLTLVPLPGHEQQAIALKRAIEEMSTTGLPGQGKTKVDIATPKFGVRSSGEPFIKLDKQHVGGHDCFILASGPITPIKWVQLMLTAGYLRGRRARRVSVMFGYMPLCRSDKDEGTTELTLESLFLDQLQNAAGPILHRIVAADLHSEQISGFARPGLITGVTFMRPMLKRAITDAKAMGKRIVLMFPDGGAAKRYEQAAAEMAEEMGIPIHFVYGDKRRISSNEVKLVGVTGDVESLKDAIVITIDDELATGGTNCRTAQMLFDKYGPYQVWAVVIHGVLCGGAVATLSGEECPITRLYISDTIPERDELALLKESGRLIVVSWLRHLAQMVYYDHWDMSIREIR